MADRGKIKQAVIEELLTENEVLHQLLFESHRQTISLLMAFIYSNADISEIPIFWLLAYIVNDDREILECEDIGDWPEGYELKTREFCDMMAYYNQSTDESLPVKDIVEDMLSWPTPTRDGKKLH